MAEMKVIGTARLRSIDGVEKVTGTASYTADYSLPGTLWGNTLKSPYSARSHRQHRHVGGEGAAGRRCRDHGPRHRRCRVCGVAPSRTCR